MIKIENELAKHIIVYGQDNGLSMGYFNNDKTIKYNVYVRILDDFKFIIAENETTDEFYAVTGNDTFQIDNEYNTVMSDLKGVLTDLIDLLESDKKEKQKGGK